MNSFTTEPLWKRNHRVLFSKVDRDTVIFDEEKGAYFAMNQVGSLIWDLLSEPKTVTELVSALQVNFHVSDSDCHRDISTFVNKMSEQKLIEVYHSDNSARIGFFKDKSNET